MGQKKSKMLTLCLGDQADAATPNTATSMVCHCLCSGAEGASSFFYSARIAELSEQRSKFDNQLEFDVGSSASHWTAVIPTSAKSDESDGQVRNGAVFEKLKEHPKWGPFFRRQPYELEIGAKIAEGGQAEIFEALGTNKEDKRCEGNKKVSLVVKVFKEGFPLDQLQRSWPPGMALVAAPPRYYALRDALGVTGWRRLGEDGLCWALGAQLLDDGRFAFIFDRYWGDLRKLIDEKMLSRNGCPPFDGRTTYRYILCIADGMRKLHKYRILHNDLKAANVLVRDSLVVDPTVFYENVHVADFESSIGIEGTGFWRAPEILRTLKDRSLHKEGFMQQTTQASDVYSFAMTCYEVITGRIPFEGRGVGDYDIILRGERPTLLGDPYSKLNDVVTKCWHQDPRQRPSFLEVVEDLEAIANSQWPTCDFRRRIY